MRMILSKLTKKELLFLLELLNSAGSAIDVIRREKGKNVVGAYVSAQEAQRLDQTADRLRKLYEKGKVSEDTRPPNAYFLVAPQDRSIRAMRGAWSYARYPLIEAIVTHRDQPNNFVSIQIVGVPAHHPPVMINEPSDIVEWLTARGMANRQLLRFVRCDWEECHKFGLRERAKKDARFCSEKCQKEANALAQKQKPDRRASFGHLSTISRRRPLGTR